MVSVRELELFSKISSKEHHEGAELLRTPLGNYRLTLSGVYTLCTLVRNGKSMPIKKYRDADVHTLLLLSAAPYALTQDQIDYAMSHNEVDKDAMLLGYAKSTQQKLWSI